MVSDTRARKDATGSPSGLLVITGAEALFTADKVFLRLLAMDPAGQVHSVVLRRNHQDEQAQIAAGASALIGQGIDLRPQKMATSVVALVAQARASGLPARIERSLTEILLLLAACPGDSATREAVLPRDFRTAQVFGGAMSQQDHAVQVSRTLALRCQAHDRAPGRMFEYFLQAELATAAAGDSPRATMLLRWEADGGWPQSEALAEKLVSARVMLGAGGPVSAACALADLALRAGLPEARKDAFIAAAAAAFADLTAGRADTRRPDYPDLLPRVSRFACFPRPPLPVWGQQKLNVYEGVTYMHPLGGNGTKGHLLERHALAYGLDTIRFSKGAFVAFDAENRIMNFKWSRTPISSGVALGLCTHKEATRACLARHGVPVPEGRMFMNGDFETAIAFANRIGYPVVCKPAAGVRGIGVVANIQNEDELRDAFRQYADSRLGGDDFIVEKHVRGRDYRILVIDGEVIAAILREPASVTGDGRSNIAELVMLKNAVRRLNPHLWPRPVKYSDAMRWQLDRAGLTLASVPEKGQLVMLSNSCSLSQGGDSIDVLDEMHPSVKAAAVASVAAIPGLRYCGVDFLIEDHARPIDGQEAGICELNAHAAIGNCEYPMFGTPREVARGLFLKSAETCGLALRDAPAEQLSIRLDITGKVTGVGYRNWLSRYAAQFGVTGSVRNIGTDQVLAELHGDTLPVAAMAAACVLGPKAARPQAVRTSQLPPGPVPERFTILDSLPAPLPPTSEVDHAA